MDTILNMQINAAEYRQEESGLRAGKRTERRGDAMMALTVQARGVHKSVPTVAGTLSILDGVDLDVARAEAIAILGASGSGKSTLLGLLAGLDLPDQGSIKLGTTELTELDEDARARMRAQNASFVFHAFHLMEDLTAEENVALPLELFGHSSPQTTAHTWLERLGLGERRRHYPAQLSGGEQQRVALCRAFATQPKVMFADEPTANLDRSTARTVIDSLFELRSQTGTTMILVTHDQTVAQRCNRVFWLHDRRLHDSDPH